MFSRILAVAALIMLVVLAASGRLQEWLGQGSGDVSRAAITGGAYDTDIRAVRQWASARKAAERCGFATTDAVAALERSNWQQNPLARRTIAQVNKSVAADEKVFCRQVWDAYGPTGDEQPGLLAQAQTSAPGDAANGAASSGATGAAE